MHGVWSLPYIHYTPCTCVLSVKYIYHCHFAMVQGNLFIFKHCRHRTVVSTSRQQWLFSSSCTGKMTESQPRLTADPQTLVLLASTVPVVVGRWSRAHSCWCGPLSWAPSVRSAPPPAHRRTGELPPPPWTHCVSSTSPTVLVGCRGIWCSRSQRAVLWYVTIHIHIEYCILSEFRISLRTHYITVLWDSLWFIESCDCFVLRFDAPMTHACIKLCTTIIAHLFWFCIIHI